MSTTTTSTPCTEYHDRPELDRPELDRAGHLEPVAMARAQRHLVAKAIAELAHERLVRPEPVRADPGWYELDAGASTYRFHAHRHELEHWVVDPGSIIRSCGEEPGEPDVLQLVVELRDELGIPAALLPTYLEELSATLASAAWKATHHRTSSADLLQADLPTIEAAMSEGHPAFLANNGRVGFGLDDYRSYAPEVGEPVRLVWLGVRRSLARLSCGTGLDEERLYREELGDDLLDELRGRLRDLGLDPDEYLLVPAHPWQWTNKLAVTFAPDVARRDVVPLGTSRDTYAPQQSIRTFLNLDHPERHYVKTALSIQNMGFMRGLSPHYMGATPAINDWVHELVSGDAELRACGFEVLRERAAVGYTGGVYQSLTESSSYQKMFSALWRESASTRLGPGERAATMASLLHRDGDGRGHAAALVRASGLEPEQWVRRYLDAYLRPLAHCLWAHDLAFMPHGENLILVLRDHVPVRVLMKDVGEEVAVLGDVSLPEGVERIRVEVDGRTGALGILTDVLDGFLRFLAADLAEDGVLAADAFWREAADCLRSLQRDHPEDAEAHARYDLFVQEFRHSCLNRLQLRNTVQMLDLTDQANHLIYVGTLANPLARG